MNESKALTLEAGKYYRTRDGFKAMVIAKNPFNMHGKQGEAFIGAIEFPKPGDDAFDFPESATSWDPSGVFNEDGSESEYDLIAEWVEPKRIKVWVNIFPAKEREDYPSGYRVGCVTHASKDDAHRMAQGMIATVEIDVLEGHGLGEAA